MKNLCARLKKHRLIYLIAGIAVAASLSGCSIVPSNYDNRSIFYFILGCSMGLSFTLFYIHNDILKKIKEMRSNIEYKLEENNVKLKEIENQLQELKQQKNSASNSEKD